MTRARVEKPNHRPLGSRRLVGMRDSSSVDFTGWNRPSCSARQRRPASTVIITSAGLRGPSLRMRSMMASSPASIRFTLMPVALVKLL
jgi:hypothetical protein